MILKDICEVYSGYALKDFNENNEGFPVIKIGNICNDGSLELDSCQYSEQSVNKKFYSNKNDIYIALSGATTGKIGMMESSDKYIINQRVGIVRKFDDNIPYDYIKFFLLNKTERILQDASGCAQPNISPKQIGQYELPLIDNKDMQHQVNILNTISQIINLRKKEIAQLDNLIKARFVELFDYKRYETVRLGDLCTRITDGTHKTPNYLEKGIIFISAKNIVKGELDLSNVKYISEDEYMEIQKRCQTEVNDILLSKSGSLGSPVIIKTEKKLGLFESLAIIKYDRTK